MPGNPFFEERSEESEVKARIVSKYFLAWATVIMATVSTRGGKLAYIDLYAGPGRYKNGAASTPLLVLQTAIDNPRLSQMLVACFNDADQNHAGSLQAEIDKLPGIEKLRFKPQVTCGEIDEEAAKYFSETKLIPAFSFVDPFGYKGLSPSLI